VSGVGAGVGGNAGVVGMGGYVYRRYVQETPEPELELGVEVKPEAEVEVRRSSGVHLNHHGHGRGRGNGQGHGRNRVFEPKRMPPWLYLETTSTTNPSHLKPPR
jgi:hypothetical protein